MCSGGVEPGDLVDVGEDEVFFDTAVGVEDRFSALRRSKICDVLTGDGVQPGQPFVAGQFDDRSIRRSTTITPVVAARCSPSGSP